MPSAAQPVYLAFHKIQDRFSFGVTNYAPERFFGLLEGLEQAGWRLRSSDHGADVEDQLVLTFDDAYAHLTTLLSELIERFGVRALVFVPTGWIGKSNRWDYSHRLAPARHMTAEQISELHQQGVQFGTHGQTHTDLSRLTPDSLRTELEQSRSSLEAIIEAPVTSISYPFGRVDTTVEKAAHRAGYELGLTMAYPGEHDCSLRQGRIPIYAFDTPLSIQMKLSGGFGKSLERWKAGTVNRLSAGTTLLERLKKAVR